MSDNGATSEDEGWQGSRANERSEYEYEYDASAWEDAVAEICIACTAMVAIRVEYEYLYRRVERIRLVRETVTAQTDSLSCSLKFISLLN